MTHFCFSKQDKITAQSALKKIIYHRKKHQAKWPIISFNNLFKILNKAEITLLKKLMAIDPRDYGSTSKYLGIHKTPKNLVLIHNQKYLKNKQKKIIKPQYITKDAYQSFVKLNKDLQKDTGRHLNIISGYRSPAYQLYVFLLYLVELKWNIKKTLQRVALPGYSEHASPTRQAIDIGPEKAISRIENFYKTKEYKWLKKNASKYGFYLSYPTRNNKGVIFEPWHWHFRSSVDK